MKKLSKIILTVLTLSLIVCSAFALTACDDGDNNVQPSSTPEFKVTFVRNYPGAEPDSEALTTVTVKSGRTVSEITPSERPAGYEFDGWYTTADGDEKFDFENTKITARTSVFAHWKSNGKSVDVSLKNDAIFKEESVRINTIEGEKTVNTGVFKFRGSAENGAIPNGESRFDFKTLNAGNALLNSDKAVYKVYSDEECLYVAGDNNDKSQIVTLNNGNNYFYLKVTAEDEIAQKVYKINMYLEPVYSVSVMTVEGDYNTVNIEKVGAGSLIERPDVTGDNPGYKVEGWKYKTKEKRDASGRIVAANGDILLLQDGVYYVSDDNGNRRFVYVDADGNEPLREGNVYYKTDKKGNVVTDNGARIILSQAELFNKLDENGMPVYETGEPQITSNGSFENTWDFSACRVNEDFLHIYCKWTQEEYTLTLTFAPEDTGAKFDGKSADVRSISLTVKYGISAATLADKIRTAVGNDPTMDYATFDGWYYNDARMVGKGSQGVSPFNITSDATFVAKWNFNVYNVIVEANDPDMSQELTGSGSYHYNNRSVQLGAIAKPGYELIGWQKNGKEWAVDPNNLATPSYELDIKDVQDGVVRIKAVFRPKTLAVTFEDELGFVDSKTINVAFASDVTVGGGANDIPEVGKLSSDQSKLFVGWYCTVKDENGNNVKKYVVEFKNGQNVISEGCEQWDFITENTTVYAEWKEYKFYVTAYKAIFAEVPDMGDVTGIDFWADAEGFSQSPYDFVGKMIYTDNGVEIRLGATVTDNNYYRFIGWYLVDMNEANPFDFDKMTKLDDENGNISFTVDEEDVTVVARWYYNPVAVTFEKGDTLADIVLPENTEIAFNSSFVLGKPQNAPDKMYFGGWYRGDTRYTDGDGVSVRQFNDRQLIIDGITLTAKWLPINYFNVEEGVITGLTDAGAKEKTLTINIDDDIFAIAAGAFRNNRTIEKLTIKGNITHIGQEAFLNSNIKSVVFEGNFKGLTIESYAFKNCAGLTEVLLPDGVVELKYGIFEGCNNIAKLAYPADIVLGSLFTAENPENDNIWYLAEQNGVRYYLPVALKEVIVTNTVNAVADYAFANCVNIKKVTLATPSSDKPYTEIIGDFAFAGTGISSGTEVQQIEVNLANVRTIGNYAFQNSTITNVAFDSLSKLGIGAFKGSNVAAADFSVAPLDYVAAHSFEGCGNLASVNLGGIKTVARYAFKDSALSSVTNADGLQKVDAYAFNGSALPSVTVFGNVEDIEEYAFHNTPYFNGLSNTVVYVGKVLYYDKNSTVSISAKTGVVSVAPYAFENSALITVDLSGFTDLEFIERYAFANNAVTSTVKLPESLYMIKESAFESSAVTTIDLSACKNLARIYQNAFKDCTNLTTVTFASFASSAEFTTKLAILDWAFSGCTKLTTVTFPENLSTLGSYAFENCTKLASVNFIGNAMFQKEESEEDPKFDTAGLITSIGEGAFINCTSLTSVSLPRIIDTIGSYAFKGCTQLASFTMVQDMDTIYTSALRTIGEGAFADCTALTNFDEDTSRFVTTLGVSAFENCSSLARINMQAVNEFTDKAFRNCEKLSTVTVRSNATIIVGNETFKNCKTLKEIDGKFMAVGDGAFMNCTSLMSVTLAQGETDTLGKDAFNGCVLLQSVVIPKNIAIIGDGAFAGCRGITSVSFEADDTLENIGIAAFSGCILLSDIRLPSSVKYVGASAFGGCNDLRNVVIGEAIEYIGEDAFALCDNVSVKFLGTRAPALGGDIFTGAQNYVIYVLSGYENAFNTTEGWGKYTLTSYVA